MKTSILLAALSVGTSVGTAAHAEPLTFCNPLNLDYGWWGQKRHGADPVIVLFNDKYFLFSTYDVPGFRVSDDLLNWRSVRFPQSLMPLACTNDEGYCAPAVAVRGEWLYFINMLPPKGEAHSAILRTRDPLSGDWEKCGQIRRVGDPALFFDDDARAWLYYGLGGATSVFEIDTQTWTEIPGSDRVLRPDLKNISAYPGGFERGRRELFAETDSAAWLDRFETLPCQEAAWMTKRNGRYYLHYSTPGTVSHWYCDNVLEGDAPDGPFRETDYGPVALKVGGFVGSAGHSGVFQDKFGNWWRVTTMWIGVHDLFERRLGLFPVGFDEKGRIYTETALGELPQMMPQGPREVGQHLAGWWLLSEGAHCTASSSLAGHAPELASDENIRTWWSAQSGAAGQWLQMDLGAECQVCAVQVNFAEQDADARTARGADHHQYKLLASRDGKNWQILLDRSQNHNAVPHDYFALSQAQNLRFFRIENVFTPGGGRFAVSGLRIFGSSSQTPPTAPRGLQVRRHGDDRNATITWEAAAGAQGYLLRYGVAPDALHNAIQLKTTRLSTHVLKRGVRYFWRVDAFNSGGLTQGAEALG